MPSKKVTQAKKLIKSWLEDFCQRNSTFKRNLFILYKQKKYKDIATAIKKDYLNGKNSSDEATNFLQNSQHVIDIMKHLESYDFSSKNNNASKGSSSSSSSSGKRSLSEAVSTGSTESKTDTKKSKTGDSSEEEEFNEDEMTSFLDQADDDAMKRFYAVSGVIMFLLMIHISVCMCVFAIYMVERCGVIVIMMM
jgi:hypothetical protein